MRNKSIFLATTAVALLTGSGAAQAGDLYISVFGGANFQHDSSGFLSTSTGRYNTTTNFSESSDTGFVLGGAVGTHLDKWAQGLRVELEVAYRRNSISGHWHNELTTNSDVDTNVLETESGPISGNQSSFSVLANVWYDIDMGWKAKPYIGGGAGWANSKVRAIAAVSTSFSTVRTTDLHGTHSRFEDQSGFAWQLGAGFNYNVAPGVDLGIGYRYFRGPSFDPLFVGKNHSLVPLDNENHAVQVNLTVGIN